MNTNRYFDKVYLVNLDRRTDRMERMKARLNALAIRYTRVSAVDGKEIGTTGNKALIQTNINIFREATNNGYKRILVLEDDCLFNKDFISLFSNHVKKVPVYDIWYLGAIVPNPDKFKYITQDHFTDIHCIYGTHAVAYNAEYLEKLIKQLEEKNHLPIDCIISEIPEKECRKWASITPMLCVQDLSESDIAESCRGAREIDTNTFMDA